MKRITTWDYEADVVIVGYGGAGAITAITSHDLGAKVLILEKQKKDTPTTINHTPSSRMAGGGFLCATDAKKAADYLYWSSWGATSRKCCDVMAEYMVTNEEYSVSLGGEVGHKAKCEYSDIAPGGDAVYLARHKNGGPMQFKILMENIDSRKIPVLYDHRGKELIQNHETGEVLGVLAEADRKALSIKARKAVVLSTGGFEWDEEMKLNYLRGFPFYFYCNPGNEGDGIRMGQKAGAALWHMNTVSGRVIPFFEGVKPAFGARFPLPFILVDKYGRRFATEPGDPNPGKYRSHAFWLECVKFDTQKAEYPRIPCYQVFDETTRLKGPFAHSMKKGLLPDGTTQYFHRWSRDNIIEIEKGWVIKGDTIEKLAENIVRQDLKNEGRMDPMILKDTLHQFNQHCRAGEDPDFKRSSEGLVPLENPPYYSLRLYPGGPNTQGGLKKNEKGQVLDSAGKVIPRLYAPGENGSYFGFLYSTGGNICENLVWGRVTGENAANEKPWE